MTDDSPTDRIDRRTLLRLGTSAGALAVAGCLGDDDSDDATDDDVPESTPTPTPTPVDTDDSSDDAPTEPADDPEAGEDGLETDLPVTGEAVPELHVFDETMVEFMEGRDVKAGVLGVARDGEIVLERGYGWADPDLTEPLSPDALFRIGSISKPITDAAIQQLLDQGELSRDDRVLPILAVDPPAGEPTDERWQDVTVQHLLDHAGGWDIQQLGYDPMYEPVRVADELDLEEPPTNDDVTRYILDQSMQFDPGSREAYSNFGYSLLGQVIEAVTGTDYQAHLEAELFAPEGIEGIELGRTRPEDRPPGEVWYDDDEQCVHAFELDPSEEYTCADAGFVLEAFDAAGGHVASTRALLSYLDAYWLTGESRGTGDREYVYFGSHPGSFAVAAQYSGGVDAVAMFNTRSLPLNRFAVIFDQLGDAADSVDEWPQ